MGAHRMNVPKELAEYKLERAEIVVYLPADWNISDHEEKNYWPLRWLKILARLPLEEDSWLGWGHSVPNGKPFAENTQLSSVLLINPENVEEGAAVCQLPNGGRSEFLSDDSIVRRRSQFQDSEWCGNIQTMNIYHCTYFSHLP